MLSSCRAPSRPVRAFAPALPARQSQIVPQQFAACLPAQQQQQRNVVVQAAAADAVAEEAGEEVQAVYRYVRGSPHKVRRVLDQIRGRSYFEALAMLEYMPYRACEPILKTLLSAAANAKHNNKMRKASLVVSECFCDEGPVMKRFRPRAQGRAYAILKPTCHITVKVREA